jgi:hypothetical protein
MMHAINIFFAVPSALICVVERKEYTAIKSDAQAQIDPMAAMVTPAKNLPSPPLSRRSMNMTKTAAIAEAVNAAAVEAVLSALVGSFIVTLLIVTGLLSSCGTLMKTV